MEALKSWYKPHLRDLKNNNIVMQKKNTVTLFTSYKEFEKQLKKLFR